MPEQPPPNASTNGTETMDALLQPYFDYWSGYYEQVNESTRRLLDDAKENTDARLWQRRWTEAVRESTDAFMRSPTFLSGMKKNMDATIKAKTQVDSIRHQLAHSANLPTSDDINDLLERLREIEQLFVTRFAAIETRLSAIENGLPTDSQHHDH